MTKRVAGQSDADSTTVMRLATSYWDAQVLLTANRMGLFDLLSEGAMSGSQIASAMATTPRHTILLLNACVSLGLLTEQGGQYANSGLGATYLVSGGRAYLGNALRYTDDLYNTWSKLEQSLRDGAPALAAANYLGDDRERTRNFVYGMHDRALGVGRGLVDIVDLAGRTRMLDVGGGPGTYSAMLTSKFEGLQSQVLELPGVAEIAGEIIESMGASKRVSMLPGDFHSTDFPPGNDVVLISGVFHRETADNCRNLIRRAATTLNPGGLLLISDVFVDAKDKTKPFAALFGLNMMLTAPDGGVHEDQDVAQWMLEAGLEPVSIKPFPPPLPHRLVQGAK